MFNSVNTCWVLVAAFLVYFMQAGFALCEAGFTRAKNTGNILMKNMMDFCIGTPCYWLIGFGLMFGGTSALMGVLLTRSFRAIISHFLDTCCGCISWPSRIRKFGHGQPTTSNPLHQSAPISKRTVLPPLFLVVYPLSLMGRRLARWASSFFFLLERRTGLVRRLVRLSKKVALPLFRERSAAFCASVVR